MDNKLEEFIESAKKLGSQEAKYIDPATIKTGAWVIMKCRYGCGRYNTRLCCPPHTPTFKETQEVIDCYKTALLIHCKSWDMVTPLVAKLEKEIFLSGYYKVFGLGCGPCKSCRPCNMVKCIKPDEVRPSMEACGIDVYETARKNGFSIDVVKDMNSEQNCYGLLLIE
jgi:predicted metal-binding protein